MEKTNYTRTTIERVHTASRWLLGGLLLLGLIILLAGCGATDASVDSRDKGNAKTIINMPDHFNNVAVKCYGKSGVYVTNNNGDGGTGSDVFVLANDPACDS